MLGCGPMAAHSTHVHELRSLDLWALSGPSRRFSCSARSRAAILGLSVSLALVLPIFSAPRAAAQQPGIDSLTPFTAFFGGVFPSTTPGYSGLMGQAVSANLGVGMLLSLTEGDGVLYAGSRDGRIIEIVPGSTSETGLLFLDISDRVWTGQDSGLLGVALHPEFGDLLSTNRGFLYLYYVHEAGDGDRFIRLSRFEKPDGMSTADASTESILIQQKLGPTLHRGGGLLFGADGYLYLSIGDLGWPNQSQDIVELFNSCVLRIDVDSNSATSHPIPTQPSTGDAETYTQGYMIPDDNPFVDEPGGVLEEYYALGTRNPHRMSIDPVTGYILIGDVGSNMSSSLEEINRVEWGANFGWPFREGSTNIATPPTTIWGTITDPQQTYPRAEGACIIGGHVYRGAAIPSLFGRYVFGDCTNNNIWAAADELGFGPKELIATAPSQLVTFGRDNAGEIYLGTGASTLYRIVSSSFVADPPALLSATGLFTDLPTLAIDPAFIPYDVTAPLWSDGADKKRWFATPNSGVGTGEIQYTEDSEWSFPAGTLFVKHFELPIDGQPARRLETRVLGAGSDGNYYGVSYRWRPDGLEADLLTGGLEEVVEGQTWTYPSRNECKLCHNTAASSVLGVRTSQQNADMFYPGTGRTAHQLETLDHLGLLDPALGATDVETLPRLAVLDDLSQFSQKRVRSYLQSNCAQCHRPGGPARGEFDARFETPFPQQNLINADVAEDFGISGAKVVVPDDVAKSILHYRDTLLGAGQMPPLARNIVHSEWATLLADWIATTNSPSIVPFSGDYYDGKNFDTLMYQQDDAVIDFDWVNGTPDASLGTDNFSIRWTGAVVPTQTETYTFYATADDGVRVYVDGVLVVDDWSDHAARETSGTIGLTAGIAVPVIVEYYEAGGQASVQIEWSSNSLSRANVMTSSPNTAPTAIPQSVVAESGQPLAIVLNGTDLEQARLDVAIVDFPVNGSLSGTGPTLTYVSNPGFVGPDPFTFKVGDGELESGDETITITVPEPTLGWSILVGSTALAAGARRRRSTPTVRETASDPFRLFG
jgi:glucose/arabinose dehydrogenase